MLDFGALFAWCDLHTSRWRPPRWETLTDLEGPNGFPRYYDRQGFPIPARDGVEATLVWAQMSQNIDYKRVAWDELPDGSYLSTVWLGLDHAFGGPPLIFETMRFSEDPTAKAQLAALAGVDRPYREMLPFPDPAAFGEETEQLRYRTEEEALAAHHEIVRRLRIRLGH